MSKTVKAGKIIIELDDGNTIELFGNSAKKTSKKVDDLSKSTQTADRNLKGAARASSNTTKNFSKMQQGLGGLVGAYATLAASIFAIGAAFRALEEASNIKNQIRGMEIFGEVTGIAMRSIVADVRAATGGLLQFRDAAQAAQIATAAGFNATQIKELATGAKLASVALGRDLTDSFNRLIRGVTKAEPELLDELGIVLRIDDATRKFAQANKVAAKSLTIAQRRSAVFEEVSRQLVQNFGEFNEQADELVNPITRLQTAFNDLIVSARNLVGPFEEIANFISRNTGAAAALFVGFGVAIIKSAFPALNTLTTSLQNFAINAQTSSEAANAAYKKQAIAFKANSNDMMASEQIRSAKSRAILRKLGVDEDAFLAKRAINQRRSVAQLIRNEQLRAEGSKKIREAELAHLIAVHKAMEASHVKMTTRMMAGIKALGTGSAAVFTGIGAAGAAGIGAIGTGVSKLSGAFAMLGTVINAAFFIFLAGFVGKFIFEMVFLTKEMREEMEKTDKVIEASQNRIKEIDRIGNKLFQGAAETAEDNFNRINKQLIATFNLINGLRDADAAKSIIGEAQTGQLSKSQRADLAGIVLEQLTTATALAGGDLSSIKSFLQGLNLSSFGITPDFDPDEMKKVDKNIFDSLPDSSGIGGLKGVLEILDRQGLEGSADLLRSIFVDVFKNADPNKITAVIGSTATQLKFVNEAAGDQGEKLQGVSDALKEFVEVTNRITFTPTAFENLASSIRTVKNDIDEAIKAQVTGAQLLDLIQTKTNRNFATVKEGLDFVRLMAFETDAIIKESAQNLRDAGIIDAKLARVGSRKDPLADRVKRNLKIEQLTNKRQKKEIEIRQEVQRLNAANELGNVQAEKKLRNLEDQLMVLQAQEDEATRANSVMGKLNDTMAQQLGNMFQSIIDGTMKASEAFKQFAKVVLEKLVEIAAAEAAANILAAFGSNLITGFAGGGRGDTTMAGEPTPLPQGQAYGRYGGIMKPKFSARMGYMPGGIADGPNAGYTAVLHGREAVIPLGQGQNAIPVVFKDGAPGGMTNSVVNVTVNSDGSSEMTEEQATGMGRSIQAAVINEIANQQRPGGMLSGG